MRSFSPVDREDGTGARLAPVMSRAFRQSTYRNCPFGPIVPTTWCHVPRETLDFLKEREVAAHVLPTAEAVELYNELAEKEPVGGLFHTTC